MKVSILLLLVVAGAAVQQKAQQTLQQKAQDRAVTVTDYQVTKDHWCFSRIVKSSRGNTVNLCKAECDKLPNCKYFGFKNDGYCEFWSYCAHKNQALGGHSYYKKIAVVSTAQALDKNKLADKIKSLLDQTYKTENLGKYTIKDIYLIASNNLPMRKLASSAINQMSSGKQLYEYAKSHNAHFLVQLYGKWLELRYHPSYKRELWVIKYNTHHPMPSSFATKLKGQKLEQWVEMGPSDYHEYFDKQKKKTAEELDPNNTGYVSVTVKEIPDACKKCMGDLCRRHCMQALEHQRLALAAQKKAGDNDKKIKTLQKMLTDAKDIKNLESNKYNYHQRKYVEWKNAHDAQHNLDVATNNWYKANQMLTAAKKEAATAKSATEKADAEHRVVDAQHKASQLKIKEVQAQLNAINKDLQQEQATLTTLTQKQQASQQKKNQLEQKAKTLKELLEKLGNTHATLTADLSTKLKAKQAAALKHQNAAAESKKYDEATKGHHNNLDGLKKKARTTHDIAREAKPSHKDKK